MNTPKYIGKKKRYNCNSTHCKIVVVTLFLIISSLLLTKPVAAQELPPKPITVQVVSAQHLEFGSIIVAGTGTVTINRLGGRDVSGSVFEKSSTFSRALFIVTSLPGTLITISDILPTFLTGSNGGTVELNINKITQTNTGAQFVSPTGTTSVYVGGTLIVRTLQDNPAGAYAGTFSVTFIQQ